jgi:glycine oxidase
MAARTRSAEVIIVGGGIIGLAVAWRAGERGMSVTVLERDVVGAGTSRVAAGMLAPVSEVEFGPAGARLLELGLRSGSSWPAFAGELEQASGEAVGLSAAGTLMVARDADEARELERQIAFRHSLGLRGERVRASRARELEPALAPTLRLALDLPDDRSVDPRRALCALRAACGRQGVDVREHASVAAVLCEGGEVRGVQLGDGEQLSCAKVVVAAGTWSGAIAGIPPGERVPVRPVKGQTLRLRDPAGPGLIERAVRFEEGYLVPRADGRYVLGGTMEERGFDEAPTAGATYELLRECHELIPGVSELEIEELCVGLRPGTPDNLPLIGNGSLDGLIWATGHFRNGILLAPLTAELVLDVLRGERRDPALLAACDPARFASPRTGASSSETHDSATPASDTRSAGTRSDARAGAVAGR